MAADTAYSTVYRATLPEITNKTMDDVVDMDRVEDMDTLKETSS